MQVYKLSPGWSPIAFSDLKALYQSIKDMIENSETGDQIIIELVEMSQKEFDALPEHQGW